MEIFVKSWIAHRAHLQVFLFSFLVTKKGGGFLGSMTHKVIPEPFLRNPKFNRKCNFSKCLEGRQSRTQAKEDLK
jgi:hypothetical protein